MGRCSGFPTTLHQYHDSTGSKKQFSSRLAGVSQFNGTVESECQWQYLPSSLDRNWCCRVSFPNLHALVETWQSAQHEGTVR